MHAMVRKKIREMPNGEYNDKSKIKTAWCPALNRTRLDFESTCSAPKSDQCPYATAANFAEIKEHRLSQGEMAATQFAFIGLFILNPKFFGLHNASDEDIQAFCHLWRGLGYLLGMDDNSNFCRGTFADIRIRAKDFLEYWVKPNFRVVKPEWEHMMRCVVEGLKYYFPGTTYETCLLDLSEIMNLHMSCTYSSLSYPMWMRYKLIRFYFDHGSKLSFLKVQMNHYLNASLRKAQNFNERKHHELKEKSTKTLESYLAQTKKSKISLGEQNQEYI